MLRYWFVPAWCGDFRLERIADDVCKLTVEAPTQADRDRLAPFFTELLKREVIKAVPLLTTGLTTLDIPLAMREAGPLLAGVTSDGAALWTAVRHERGTISLVDGTAVTAPDAQAAATVKEPKKGCPEPVAAERRAHEVLRTFCTTPQWASYQQRGYLTARGNMTGKAYHVFHRGEAARRRLSRCLVEAATGAAVCVWDDEVPPSEEVLALKFAVEHRERWLLRA